MQRCGRANLVLPQAKKAIPDHLIASEQSLVTVMVIFIIKIELKSEEIREMNDIWYAIHR
jgi:hypothetical protein